MRTSQQGLKLIKEFEGCRLKAYRDAVGVLTIGYGHTGPDVYDGQQITLEQAEELLTADLIAFESNIEEQVTTELRQNEFDALVSLSYNIGQGAFNSSTLLRLLNQADIEGAAAQFLRWNRAGGRVLAGLTRRREAERLLFLGD